ncbi:MAG TPA: phage holin family protein [Allosphingosinicella sp.]
MDAQTSHPPEPTIGDLFGRLADEGKSFARAEANLYRAIAMRRISLAKNGAIALVATMFLVNAGLIALTVGLAMQLAKWVGPALGGLIVFLVVGALGYFLVRYGVARLGALGGDEEERAALQTGERLA